MDLDKVELQNFLEFILNENPIIYWNYYKQKYELLVEMIENRIYPTLYKFDPEDADIIRELICEIKLKNYFQQ